MRTNLSIVILQLTAMVGLAAIAVAQSEETSTPPAQSTSVLKPKEPAEQTDGAQVSDDAKASDDAIQAGETVRGGMMSSSALIKRLDDAFSLIATLKTKIEKIEFRSKEEASLALKALSSTNGLTQLPQEPADLQIPAAPALPGLPTPAKAEVDGSEAFDPVSGDSASAEAAVGNYIDTMPIPVLNGSTPDWVKNGLVLGEDHRFAISSTLMPDLEQCREDLKTRMMSDVRVYLDKHVLQFSEAERLPELTQEYVEKYWVKKGQVFDNLQDRPSGTYHQLWIGLHIPSEQLAKIREWEKQTVREQRTRSVGILGGVGICAITLLSGAVGLLARREKAKLKG